MATSVDTLISGVHFTDDTTAKDIAHKALAVNLSDLAAMGATPLFFTLALTLPSVDDKWLENAIVATDEIHSEGSLTNIADALEDASKFWVTNEEDNERHVILLTDGIIDVSDDAFANEESRVHILETILPNYQRGKVYLHTIALSENADLDLLERLFFFANLIVLDLIIKSNNLYFCYFP